MSNTTINTNKLLAKMRALKALKEVTKKEVTKKEVTKKATTTTIAPTIAPTLAPVPSLGKSEITYDMLNTKQKLAVSVASQGKSFCLIGAAGYGKTTTTKSIINTLLDNNIITNLAEGTKKVLSAGKPSVAIVSFTNQAVRNIKEALPLSLKPHCSTIHKLLEYSPVRDEIEVTDEDGNWTGEYRNTMYYAPTYGTEPSGNGDGEILPHLDVVIVEEAGTVTVDLWHTLLSAMDSPQDTIFIFLGDLNQLTPVFGDGILGYKLLELPIIELNQAYRNVGLVTKFAHRILEGKPILDKELKSNWFTSDNSGSLEFHPFKTVTTSEVATTTLGSHFKKLVMANKFDVDNDVLLVPFNKQLGTIALNKWLNHGLDLRDNRVVWQVKAGYLTSYFALGDKVLYNKQYCKIVDIEVSTSYVGDLPMKESVYMDRWGRTTKDYQFRTGEEALESSEQSIDALMAQALEAVEEKTTLKASHIITLQYLDEDLREGGVLPTFEIDGAGAVNSLLHVLAMTVHKSQGSEWRKVWLILHSTHAVMFKREVLYTACTRARQDLTIYYSGQNTAHKIGGSAFSQGITNQEIAGNTIEAKLKYFTAKVQAKQVQDALASGKGIPTTLKQAEILHTY